MPTDSNKLPNTNVNLNRKNIVKKTLEMFYLDDPEK